MLTEKSSGQNCIGTGGNGKGRDWWCFPNKKRAETRYAVPSPYLEYAFKRVHLSTKTRKVHSSWSDPIELNVSCGVLSFVRMPS